MPPPDPAAMGPGEVASRSPLDKPFAALTDEDIAQLTREDCRRFLKAKGMRRPSWNKSQAIQQVISLKALFEGRPGCDDSPAGGRILRKLSSVTSAPVSPPQVVTSLWRVLTRRPRFDLCLLLLPLPELAPSGDGGRQRRGRQWSATSVERALAVPEEGPVSTAILCRRPDLQDPHRRTRPSSPAGEPMLLPQVRLLARPKWSPNPQPQPPATLPLPCAGFLIRRPGGVRPRTKWASCPICLHDGGRNLPCSLFSHTAFPMRCRTGGLDLDGRVMCFGDAFMRSIYRATTDLPGEQMTIFYDGMVNVYDDVSADQARAIMELAASPACFDDPTDPLPPARRPVFRLPPGPVAAAPPFARAFPIPATGRMPHRVTGELEGRRVPRETEPGKRAEQFTG
ncbi:leaf development [Musa troglodytarum]|uniref:Protein TIFY n=1 Tax=Musa troglodytarum TaxID=320322 RepID=A0A9E7KXS3_9LILI|nr:leaf development [Musa troglodytarum]